MPSTWSWPTAFLMEVYEGILPRLVDYLLEEETTHTFHYITPEFSLVTSTPYLHNLKSY